MNDVNKKAFMGFLNLVIVLAALTFLPAWDIFYWQAWIFLFAFFIPALFITIYLMKNDPELLKRRVNAGPKAEKEKSQKIIQVLASIAFISVIVVPSIDHRFGWSSVPFYWVIAGDILVVTGFFIVFLVFRENTYTSATIEVFSEQKIISTGPYASVRHPMYSGALIMLSGIPPALGSWWGLFAIIPFTFVIALRLLDEEKFLVKNLTGYSSYQKKVKYRLLPFIW